ncbi:MAG: response regulator [Lachnospiraceae bacterium]|nr:response regulator [Lachnospiraceae bacterium]
MQEAVYYLSFTIAAFIFNLALCVLVSTYGSEDRQRNLTFRNFTYFVLLGNGVTICDTLFRRYSIINVPFSVRLAFYLLSLFSNVMLTYFFASYSETYCTERKKRDTMSMINLLFLIACGVLTVVCFFLKLPYINESRHSYAIAPVPRFILAYLAEIYFLLYSIVTMVIRSKELNRRAKYTAALALGVTLAVIIFEMNNNTGILFNYFGAVLGLFIFYIGVETPDYRNLMRTLRELEDAREQADRANDFKSDFLANMSHEIRTPINAVIGMNEMILREGKDPDIVDYSKNIESAGKSLLSIINGILDLSKIEAGKMEILEEPYSIDSVLNDVSVMISFKAREKNLSFEIIKEPGLPEFYYGDETRIRQIMVNILNNAVKYTDKGGVTLTVGHDGAGKDCILLLTVTDTGIGIKEEDVPKLFGKFDRMDIDHNKFVEGTGLGLSIVKRLLDIMRGSVEIESTYGKGTAFRMKVPQRVCDDGNTDEALKHKAEALRKERAKKEELFHAPRAKILVVDDTQTNLTVAKALLKRTRAGVDTAGSGPAAIEITKDCKYDLILLDSRMPGMNGAEALHVIRSQSGGLNADTPIICLTADAVVGAKERYLSEGFTDYLSKPIESFALEGMLMKYLPQEMVEVL